MIKRFLQKILGSFTHSKHGRYRHSSGRKPPYGGSRHSSDQGYGQKNQGQNHYKNKYRSSS